MALPVFAFSYPSAGSLHLRAAGMHQLGLREPRVPARQPEDAAVPGQRLLLRGGRGPVEPCLHALQPRHQGRNSTLTKSRRLNLVLCIP